MEKTKSSPFIAEMINSISKIEKISLCNEIICNYNGSIVFYSENEPCLYKHASDCPRVAGFWGSNDYAEDLTIVRIEVYISPDQKIVKPKVWGYPTDGGSPSYVNTCKCNVSEYNYLLESIEYKYWENLNED